MNVFSKSNERKKSIPKSKQFLNKDLTKAILPEMNNLSNKHIPISNPITNPISFPKKDLEKILSKKLIKNNNSVKRNSTNSTNIQLSKSLSKKQFRSAKIQIVDKNSIYNSKCFQVQISNLNNNNINNINNVNNINNIKNNNIADKNIKKNIKQLVTPSPKRLRNIQSQNISGKISKLTSLNASKDISKINIPQIKLNQIDPYSNVAKLKKITSLKSLNKIYSIKKRSNSNSNSNSNSKLNFKNNSNEKTSLLLNILASKRNSCNRKIKTAKLKYNVNIGANNYINYHSDREKWNQKRNSFIEFKPNNILNAKKIKQTNSSRINLEMKHNEINSKNQLSLINEENNSNKQIINDSELSKLIISLALSKEMIPKNSENCSKISNNDIKGQQFNEHLVLVKFIKNYISNFNELPPTTLKFYQIIKQIGKGAFAQVALAKHRLTNSLVAIKIISKEYLKDSIMRNKILTEVYIHKKINHKGVIRLYEVFEDSKYLYIVLEYGAKGDLLVYVKENGVLQESEARHLFRQIVYAVANIHSHSVFHRDIKLDNIILDKKNRPKICDFGVCIVTKKGNHLKEQCGTPAYLAPEVVTQNQYEGFYVDLWSLGVVLYAMVTASVPFRAESLEELKMIVESTKIKYPKYISEELSDLLHSLLDLNPKERYSIPQILAHKWMNFSEFRKSDVLDYKDCSSVIIRTSSGTQDVNFIKLGNLFLKESKVTNEVLLKSDIQKIIQDTDNTQFNEKLIEQIEGFGYPKSQIIKTLETDEINHIRASYYILAHQK